MPAVSEKLEEPVLESTRELEKQPKKVSWDDIDRVAYVKPVEIEKSYADTKLKSREISSEIARLIQEWNDRRFNRIEKALGLGNIFEDPEYFPRIAKPMPRLDSAKNESHTVSSTLHAT